MALSAEQEAGLNAMFDADDGGAPAPATAPAAAPATPVAAPAASEADTQVAIPDPVPAPESESQWDEKTTKYIKELRGQAENYRNRAKRFNEVFDGYEPEAVEEWMSLASGLKEDPQAAAERFAELADAIRGQFKNPDGAAADAAVADAAAQVENGTPVEEVPLTRAQFETLMAEREQKADLAMRVAKIETDAVGLGYSKGTEAYDELLFHASRLPSGSIQDAHAKIVARNQAVVDAYVADLSGKPGIKVPAGGAPASGEQKYSSFAEASSALDAWLANES